MASTEELLHGPAGVDDASLPVLPLSPLLQTGGQDKDTATAFLSAFQSSGFLYLTDYASIIPESVVKAVFTQSSNFFARPISEKNLLEWTSARSNRGYTCQGREKVSQGLTKEDVAEMRQSDGEDMKESFEIGRDDEERYPNHWPRSGPDASDFKAVMLDFFLRCKELHKILMSAVAVGLGLNPAFFNGFVRNGDNTLRLLHYPAAKAGDFQNGRRVRAGAHTDYGSVTLLFQDDRGGLQVEHPRKPGNWLNVAPRPNTIVVNAGDLLARWSNDTIKSTKHRVVEPPTRQAEGYHPPRYSVAYFCNPDFDRSIEVLPGTWEGQEGGKRYGSVNSGEYLFSRLAATY